MNATSLIRLSAVALIALTAVTGCKKRPERVTAIPNLRGTGVVGEKPGGPLDAAAPIAGETTPSDNVIPVGTDLAGWSRASEQPFAAQTVYFDVDKAVIRPSEVRKIEEVATRMKEYRGKGLRIEGHCDERGTEEYNRALGERRALEVRQKLVSLGLPSQLVDTISYGEDRPTQPGHDAAAWSKNRRAEFILLEPPSSASAQ